MRYNWPVRTICQVLEEMRASLNTLDKYSFRQNKSILLSLVEEIQTLGNRMEAGLEYGRDLDKLHKERKKLQKEVESLEEKLPKKKKKGRKYREFTIGGDDD